MSLSRSQVLNAVTTSPWTKNFNHLKAFPRHWMRRVTRHDTFVKAVREKERIKYWNVVPGDQVRLRGDKENVLREVLSINKLSNRVFLKGTKTTSDGNSIPATKNYHYSRCQLYVGEYEFPATRDTPSKLLPVFAERLGTSKPYWNKKMHRFDWQRFATRMFPQVPYLRGEKTAIPWPRVEKPQPPTPGAYDTKQEDVVEVTYKPPSFSFGGPIPRPPPEKKYLLSFFDPKQDASFGEAPPVEIFLAKELSNPHSRAKKQARWQLFQQRKKSLLQDLIREELKDLQGRTAREARAEATWKWREQLEAEKKAERKRRWKNVANVARMARKKGKKEKRELRKRRKLTELVLKEEHNQVIPSGVSRV